MFKILKKKYSITFDLDWAPDFAIEKCLDILSKFNIKGTFFSTHHTDFNQEILRQGHCLGIHPNFLANSSHGNSINEIIENCLKFNPNAWCMRSHSLFQSSKILYKIFKTFPQLKLDLSLFMHRAKYVQKTKWEYDGVSFDRIMYNWEDDAEFSYKRFSKKENIFFGNTTIFNFHPIHVFLNSYDGSEYNNLKNALNNRKLNRVSLDSAKKFCNNKSNGIQFFLRRVLSSSRARSISLGDVK